MNKKETGKTIIVLGMHRSGTSMIAGVLNILGVNMGKELMGKHPSNPLGHFEDLDFYKLNLRILGKAGGNWSNPPTREAILMQKKEFDLEIKSLVEKKNKGIWGWKDPRNSLTIELYLSYLKNPYFIVCYRTPEEVAKSLKRRDNLSIEDGIKIKNIYDSRIKIFFEKNSKLDRLDLNYKEVTMNSKKWVRKIINFLELKVNTEKIEKPEKFIMPNKDLHKLFDIKGTN